MNPLELFGGIVRQWQGKPAAPKPFIPVQVRDLGNRRIPKALPTSSPVVRTPTPRFSIKPRAGVLGAVLAGPDLLNAIPQSVEAATGLFEAAENLVRGGWNPQQLRATTERMNTPGYQSIPGASNPPVEAGLGVARGQQRFNNEASYITDTLFKGRLPYTESDEKARRPVGTQATLGGRPVLWDGERWKPLIGGGSSTRLNSLNSGKTPSLFIQDQTTNSNQSILSSPGGGTFVPVTNPSSDSPAVIGSNQVSSESAATPNQIAQSQLADLVKQLGSTQDVSNLAFQTQAPLSFKTAGGQTVEPTLSQYYDAQEAYGQQVFNEKSPGLNSIIQQLGYDDNMRKWAIANPMLAQREYVKYLSERGQNPAIQRTSSQPSSPPGMGLKGNWIDENPLNLSGGLA